MTAAASRPDAAEVLAGVDGCRGGWLAVVAEQGVLSAVVVPRLAQLLERLAPGVRIAIDMPIGLPDTGPRACDVEARRRLGRPRGSSVFPAPVRAVLGAASHAEACRIHQQTNGRRMSRQAFNLLPRIYELDQLLRACAGLRERVVEVHPELAFAVWNGGKPIGDSKRSPAGRARREALIDARWPGVRLRVAAALPRGQYRPDDLNDAFAALWSAARIASGCALRLPPRPQSDAAGLPMQISA